MMTVAELIAKLEDCPPDMRVLVHTYEYAGTPTAVQVEESGIMATVFGPHVSLATAERNE